MAILRPDSTSTLGGVTVKEYCLPNITRIALICRPLPWQEKSSV